MNDFEYDCMIKKRLASQAKYRKRGSKSKKCSLSTDHMTEKQWRERNGKVMTVSLNKPMGWDEFTSLPTTLQSEYIKHLISKYNANATRLAEMFGVGPRRVLNYVQQNDLGVTFHVGHSMNKEQRKAWNTFLSQRYVSPVPEPEQEEAEQITLSHEEPDAMSMTDFSLTFNGKIDISRISNSLLWMLGNDSVGEVHISCHLT